MSINIYQQGVNLQRAALNNISNNSSPITLLPNDAQNPYQIETPYGVEDRRWML